MYKYDDPKDIQYQVRNLTYTVNLFGHCWPFWLVFLFVVSWPPDNDRNLIYSEECNSMIVALAGYKAINLTVILVLILLSQSYKSDFPLINGIWLAIPLLFGSESEPQTQIKVKLQSG